ncbi:hypothetical protein M2350_003033, partial [Candidatus Fervidibacter sacchari]
FRFFCYFQGLFLKWLGWLTPFTMIENFSNTLTASLQAGMFALPYNRGKGKAQSLSSLDAEITLEAP